LRKKSGNLRVKEEIKFILFLLGLGGSLVAYAHATFATKTSAQEIKDDVKDIRIMVYDLWTKKK
jgi:hypothetical protein